MAILTFAELHAEVAAFHAAEAARNAPAAVAVTPKGVATVAARRLASALAELPYSERTQVLAELVISVSAAPMGDTYSLLISSPPTRDPQLA